MQVKRVESRADWDAFIGLPWEIYRGDPHWVPPLRMMVKELLDVAKNPFFKHAYMIPLLAWEGDRPIGRMVGIIDDHHNKFHNERTAFFGFFESINDPRVAKALFDELIPWARSRGIECLRGPMNPSTNHECGLLVTGFQDSPSVMMTYNPDYYPALIEAAGFRKAKDLFAYEINRNAKFSEKLLAHAERLKHSSSISFRTIDTRHQEEEIERILEIYNDAWEHNWGFVPIARDEFIHLARDLKLIMDPRLVLIAEVLGKPAAFALALPDVNQVFRKVSDGRLFPTGIFKLLWNLKGPGRTRTIDRMRIVTLGVRRAYRELGLGALLYAEYYKRGVELGYRNGEASWILEDNRPMNQAARYMGAQHTKTYRIYDLPLH